METWPVSYYTVQMRHEHRLREAENARRTWTALQHFELPAMLRSLLLLFF